MLPMSEEIFEIVDANDQIIGTATRAECHGNPTLIHRTAHVVVYHSDGRLLLQKRTMTKDIQPGKWDTAVGGHLDVGESYEEGARREMNEELGLAMDLPLELLFHSKIRNEIESENIAVYKAVYDGPFDCQLEEIDEVRFWTKSELNNVEKQQEFTPNLLQELRELNLID